MLHLSTPQGMTLLELAKQETEIYLRHGIHPLIENYFGSHEDCATVLEWISEAHPEAVYGLNILGDYPVVVGAGVTLATAKETALRSDGAIVGSWFKEEHDASGVVNEQHVAAFMKAWNGL